MIQFDLLYRTVKRQQDAWADQARLDALLDQRRADETRLWRAVRQTFGGWLISSGHRLTGTPRGLLQKGR